MNPLLDDSGEDADGDGATNLEEFRAGMNPTSRDSVFKMKGRNLGGRVLLAWTAVPGKTYRLVAAPTPEGPFEFVRLVDAPAEGGTAELSVDATARRQFFLITTE